MAKHFLISWWFCLDSRSWYSEQLVNSMLPKLVSDWPSAFGLLVWNWGRCSSWYVEWHGRRWNAVAACMAVVEDKKLCAFACRSLVDRGWGVLLKDGDGHSHITWWVLLIEGDALALRMALKVISKTIWEEFRTGLSMPSLSLSMHRPLLSLSLSMYEPMLSQWCTWMNMNENEWANAEHEFSRMSQCSSWMIMHEPMLTMIQHEWANAEHEWACA